MVVSAATGALVYDRREKRRAVARWSRLVAPLAKEPLRSGPSEMPRRLTVVVGSPPGDGGFRPAMEMWTEYVRPILASSGVDWEFVQGRREGDVRAAVAERVRRWRMSQGEKAPGDEGKQKDEGQMQTEDEIILAVRKRNGIAPFSGVAGDIVIGRHTWKEYIRGLHEGWLGPLCAPPHAVLPPEPEPAPPADGQQSTPPKKKPRQIPPYNSPEDYEAAPLPPTLPDELPPSAPIPLPHILGFSNTLIRLRRYFNQRALADAVGREVAAVCLAHYREYRDEVGGESDGNEPGATTAGDDHRRHVLREIEDALKGEEKDWPKRVWKEAETAEAATTLAAVTAEKTTAEESSSTAEASSASSPPTRPKERIWTSPIVLDPRLASRMRRFEMTPEDEARAAAIVVPETEVEGWIKGSLRSAWQWAVARANPPKPKVWVEDDE